MAVKPARGLLALEPCTWDPKNSVATCAAALSSWGSGGGCEVGMSQATGGCKQSPVGWVVRATVAFPSHTSGVPMSAAWSSLGTEWKRVWPRGHVRIFSA